MELKYPHMIVDEVVEALFEENQNKYPKEKTKPIAQWYMDTTSIRDIDTLIYMIKLQLLG